MPTLTPKFQQTGIGAVNQSIDIKLLERMSTIDFGVVGDGATDDTAAMQIAIDASVVAGKILFIPAGTYKITSTLTLPQYARLEGENTNMSTTGGSKISFEPSSLDNLFEPTAATAFQVGFSLENLYIVGNSASAAGNSGTCINCIDITKSTFKNLQITNFRTGIRCEATINNRFEFLQIVNCYLYCIYYTGDNATTDVWEQCYIANAPIGVQTNGVSIGIRFNNCIFESLTTYGVNLVKDLYGWAFVNCYAEDTPSANVATNAMFRVGFDGTTLPITTQLSIIGGNYGGRNAGLVGSFLDVDFTDGVSLGGMVVARYTNVIKTSANTQTNQIVCNGLTAVSISAIVSDETKVVGFYPKNTVNSGFRNSQVSNFYTVNTNSLNLASSAIATTGTDLNLGKATSTTVGIAGGASALPATPLGYLSAYLGATEIKIPYYKV